MIKQLSIPLMFFMLAACNPAPKPVDYGTFTVTDALGREVTVPSDINKVVGVRAGSLRFLVYMDAVNMIAGIEESELQRLRPYTIAYPQLLNLPVIGPSMGGDAELILNAGPDVIFMSYAVKGDADALQKKTGIPVVAIECPEFGTNREALYASFQLIGQVLGKEERAEDLIRYIKTSVTDLEKRSQTVAENEKPTVYIGGVSYSGAHGITSTQPNYPPFMFVNAGNVAANMDDQLVSHVKGAFVDKEQLMIWNPDMIFIDQSGFDLVKNDLSQHPVLFESLEAIEKNRIYVLFPYNNYATNYELVLANAWYTGKLLYPETFHDVIVEEKVNDILKVFLGKPLLNEIIKNVGGLKTIDKSAF
jgi:iron complex transport system substrate-binding protein